jgi:hypothetical protein
MKFLEAEYSKLSKKITSKVLLIIAILLLIPTAFYFSLHIYQDFSKRSQYKNEQEKEKSRNEALEKRIEWKIDTSVYDNMSITSIDLKTKYFNDKCYYLASITLKNKNDQTLTKNNTIHINFIDKDMFTLYSFDLNYFDRTSIVNKENDIVGARWEGQLEINKDLYEKFANVRLTWTFQ